MPRIQLKMPPSAKSNVITQNLRAVLTRIERAAHLASRDPATITLVAVSKAMGVDEVRSAFEAGARHFGENRFQEAQSKLLQLSDIRDVSTWHMVGKVQTNKAKGSIQVFDIIQSIDSIRLGNALDKLAGHRLPVLLEVNVAGEPTKSGFLPKDMSGVVKLLSNFKNLDIRGVMTVAPAVTNPEDVRPVFRALKDLAVNLELPELSMGMTNDFEVAIQEGSTMVRIGTAIFGERPPR